MRLPPLNALRAFEAAARHGGFTGAADELFVSRGAVSRHVKLLEEHLGVPLFRRLPQGVELTEAGRRLLPTLSDSFAAIENRIRDVTERRGDLRIICTPTMSIRWLIPKLGDFHARHPDIRVQLNTIYNVWEEGYDGGYDLALDCEVVLGRKDIMTQPLFPMAVVPACAPSLLEGPIPLKQPEDLARFTLLQETPNHHDWTEWQRVFKVPGLDPASGEMFPNLDMAVRVALMGRGIVMGDLVLTREEFETGQLVKPFPEMVCMTDWGDFALRGRVETWDDPKVVAFRDWAAEMAEHDAEYCAAELGER